MTRAEYMRPYIDDAEATRRHREYFGQFVSARVRALVVQGIGKPDLDASTDEHLNDIRLGRWDAMVSMLPASVPRELKEQGDYLTLGTGVCILKEAARQIKEGL